MLIPAPFAAPPGTAYGPRKSAAGKIVAAIILLVALVGGAYYGYSIWKKSRATQPQSAAIPAQPSPVGEAAAPAAPQPAQPPPAGSQPAVPPSAVPQPAHAVAGTAPATPPRSSGTSGGTVYEGPVVGDWRGRWENSLGQHGDASWEVSSDYGGDVRGIWDSILFQGRHRGNIVTFHVDGGQRSCNDYDVKVEISPQGNTADFSYNARNHCSGSRYTGTEELQLRTRSGSAAPAGVPQEQASRPAKFPEHGLAVPPAAGSSPTPIDTRNTVQNAVVVRSVPPQYPPVAKAAGITGVVRLRVIIGADGNVRDVSVISGNPILAKSAVDAVRKWQYRPILVNSRPTEAETEAAINFTSGGR